MLGSSKGLQKSYVGEVVLGTSTSTLDASGEVTGTWDMSGVTIEDARSAAVHLTGTHRAGSADGVCDQGRWHEAPHPGAPGRGGESEPRLVTVDRFEVTELTGSDEPGVFRIEVDCSTGTYVRSLAADLGTALGGGAHLRNLRRTKVGSFGLAEAHRLDELAPEHVLTPAPGLRDLQRLEVTSETARRVAHGLPDRPGLAEGGRRRGIRTVRSRRPCRDVCSPCTSPPALIASSPHASSRRSLESVEVIAGSESCTPPAQGGAVTIGAYDGVHLGHQMLLRACASEPTQLGLVTEVVTFDRHPATVVRPDSAPCS
jgi:tRNA pseudouridine(55) synthase